jgi:hypothetical protein
MANSGGHPTVDTTLQAVLTHGKHLSFYRHFGNVPKGANVAIYVWLNELQRNLKADGRLPDTLFHQIDGAPTSCPPLLSRHPLHLDVVRLSLSSPM